MSQTLDPRKRIAWDAGFYILSMIFLLLRFGQRCTPTSIRQLRRDRSLSALLADLFMFIALATTTTGIGMDIWLQKRTIYLSSDSKYLPQLHQLYIVGMKFLFANQMFWALIMWSVKASLMALYYDISSHVTNRLKMLMHVTSVLLFVTILAVISVSLGWCRPISTNWSLGPDMCTSQAHVFPVAFTSTLHIITDILVLSIPLLILRTLRLQRAQIVAIYFIFGVGFLAFAVTLVSLGLQIQVVGVHHESSSYFQEIEIKGERVYLAGVGECSIAMVGANLPSLRVFLRMILKTRDASSPARRVKISSGSAATKYSKEKHRSLNSNKQSNWSVDLDMTLSGEDGVHSAYPGYHHTTKTATIPPQPGSPQSGRIEVDDPPAVPVPEGFNLQTSTPATISRTDSLLGHSSEPSRNTPLKGLQDWSIGGVAHELREPPFDMQTLGRGNCPGHERQHIELSSMQNYYPNTNEGVSVQPNLPSQTNTGIGITVEYDVQYTNVPAAHCTGSMPVETRRQHSELSADSGSHRLPSTGFRGHQRTWSGPGAPIPVPLPVSSKRWQN